MSELLYGFVGGVRVTPERDADTGRITRVVIDVADTDEAAGFEFGRFLTDDGCLAGLLAAVLHPDHPTHHRDDFTATLNALATARDLARDRIPHLATIARDRSAWSWRRIANAVGIAHRTVERQVTAARREMADSGVWVDAFGLHDGTTEQSRHLSRDARVAVARGLAHHRETVGTRWDEPVEITVDRFTPGQITTAAARHRLHPDYPVTRLVVTKPETLFGGPADGRVVDLPTGATEHTTAAGDRYAPDSNGHWTYEGDL